MNQISHFDVSMTHSFLSYAESMPVSNQKVQVLIDDLRKGLIEEKMLEGQDEKNRLFSQRQKNVLLCQCILLHVQCLADVSDNNEQYNRFINDWNDIAAS